jgi:hypothetical protein
MGRTDVAIQSAKAHHAHRLKAYANGPTRRLDRREVGKDDAHLEVMDFMAGRNQRQWLVRKWGADQCKMQNAK